MTIVDKGDAILVPNSAYLIHPYGSIITGADARHVPIDPDINFFAELENAVRNSWPKLKILLLNFLSNPTTQCVDLAYADLVFDGYQAPSILQVEDTKDVAVEFFTLSKSYNMPDPRVTICQVGGWILYPVRQFLYGLWHD